MKNRILYLLATLLLFSGCSFKEDYANSTSPDERILAAMELYTNTLLSAPNGWFLDVNTGVKGGFRHWVAFDADNKLSMLSDMDAVYDFGSYPDFELVGSSRNIKQSTWYMKYDQWPLLSFDTYNYLHFLQDPQGRDNVYKPGNGGSNGTGLKSDFEFYIEGVKNGTLSMVGRFSDCASALTQATAEETKAVMNGDLKTIHEKTNVYIATTDFLSGDFGGLTAEFSLSSRMIITGYVENGELITIRSGCRPDFASVIEQERACSNLMLFEPIEIRGSKITAFESDNVTFYAVMENGDKKELVFTEESSLPLNLGYRKDYTVLTFSTDLPGTHSQEFVDNILRPAIDNFETKRSPRKVDYINLTFGYDDIGKRPNIRLLFRYTNTSTGSGYTGTWYYRFEDNGDGTITITDRDQSGSSTNSNEYTNEAYIKPILNYFCHVEYSTEGSFGYDGWVKSNVIPKTFEIRRARNRTVGSTEIAGALVPVDMGDEDPTFVPYPCIGLLN